MNPLSRRQLIAGSAGALLTTRSPGKKRVAAITTVYTHNSHADVILSRLFQGENLDLRPPYPRLELVSLYVDQFPENDLSRRFAKQYGFRLVPTIAEALSKPVDGVLIVGEHGHYPQNEKGQDLYPRKRFFDDTFAAFHQSGRVVPVFVDKHLSHSWPDAKAMYDEARRMRVPLMAGSSVPGTWRRPPIELRRRARLNEAVAISYHTLYGYGFHALEMLQCIAERRGNGEVGVRRVRCIEGPKAWEAEYDRRLLRLALDSIPAPANVEAAVPNPSLFQIEYLDGFRASVFTLNPAVGGWSIAWRDDDEIKSTLFWTQEERPLGHFAFLLRGIERMIHTGRPSWPVERTLLTTGMMDFLLTSRIQSGRWIDTPELAIRYEPTTDWKNPGPPPPGRPLDQQ